MWLMTLPGSIIPYTPFLVEVMLRVHRNCLPEEKNNWGQIQMLISLTHYIQRPPDTKWFIQQNFFLLCLFAPCSIFTSLEKLEKNSWCTVKLHKRGPLLQTAGHPFPLLLGQPSYALQSTAQAGGPPSVKIGWATKTIIFEDVRGHKMNSFSTCKFFGQFAVLGIFFQPMFISEK